MAYKYTLIKENLPKAEDIDSFIDKYTLDPMPELGFPNGLSLRDLINDYIRMYPIGSQMSEDAEVIIQLTLEFNGFNDTDINNYLNNLNRQRTANLNESEDPIQKYLTALLKRFKRKQTPKEQAQNEKNTYLGNTFKTPEELGKKNLAKEVTHRLSEIKKKADRCKRIADRKYDKPSAYKSGAIVRCRQGDIWKDIK